MAYDNTAGAVTFSATAAADLSASQYRLVQLTADNTVNLCTAITDIPVGVLQNKPASGRAASVLVAGISKLEAGATLAAGSTIATAIDAQAQVAVSTQYVIGQVIAGSAADEICTAAINCLSPILKA